MNRHEIALGKQLKVIEEKSVKKKSEPLKLVENRPAYYPNPRTVQELIKALAGYQSLNLGGPRGQPTEIRFCRTEDGPYFLRIKHLGSDPESCTCEVESYGLLWKKNGK